MILDDTELIERCKMEDPEAWVSLMNKYSKRIFNIAFQFTGCYEDAEDLTQEIFIKLFHSLKKFDTEIAFLPWLIRLTKNYCVDDYRMRRRRRIVFQDDDLPSKAKDYRDVPLDSLLEKERLSLILRGLQTLPIELRTAVILRDFHGFNYSEIAEILEVPEGTVKSRINRGRMELATYLKKRRDRDSRP